MNATPERDQFPSSGPVVPLAESMNATPERDQFPRYQPSTRPVGAILGASCAIVFESA
jgi:hypothetical protein